MLISPDVPLLPYKLINGVKHFELIAEPVQREILPGLYINGWGYSKSIPGPTIAVYPGEHVNIRVYNDLPEPTSIHWHGLDIPNSMDGVPDVEPTPRIQPGTYFDYSFTVVNPPGTHMYHTHVNSARQEMMGLAGGFIILEPEPYLIQRDYFYLLQEFKVKGLPKGVIAPGVYDLDPLSMEFNFFTVNGRCFPYVTPMSVCYGENARIRLANSSHQPHPMHLHGHQFSVVASDGNSIAPNQRLLKNTLLVGTGETWDLEFLANNPGNWPFHCHIPHHMANNFSKSMGGMFTTVVYRQ